ncbi:HIT family protein [Tenuibacillus multivorans]|uniref:Histidine triad (HIT) family protein n=1 Tax=Tenuibacillus multivorans TaxID=237069 RepID=A0A1H0ATX0_9BACI|nr:HIT family protein [Tenuibacillus multivorans]GEL77824.1 HIT family protein [Tenuibacillus multivorans]SDN36809.1 histidine triad (HIT) family protein [Tenuibacillus multivorans]
MNNCMFCHTELVENQTITLSNEHCLFLQLDQFQVKGTQLEGSGLIVPRKHREAAFDLTEAEWNATYSLLQEVKTYIDEKHRPHGYNLGWNCEYVAGQSIFHAHLHVIPRYDDEPMAGKGIRYFLKSKDNVRA